MSRTKAPITAADVTRYIETFVADSPLNRLDQIDETAIFDPPIVGTADGDDPLFSQYKTIIGPFHLTPREVLAAAPGGLSADGSLEQISVICWVLPISAATRASNAGRRSSPSVRWAHTRHYGEQFNEALRRHVEEQLRDAGHLAAAPVLQPEFKRYFPERQDPLVSTWSERHALYAAGLGTFSLNDALITPRGIAVRCGSVVTSLPLDPSPRRCRDHTSNCLYLDEGSCGDCIDRCPAGAISHEGHDKLLCRQYCHLSDEAAGWRRAYGVTITGCGLCQTGVPCEDRIPDRLRGTAAADDS